MNKKFYVQSQPRGNRIAYIVRDHVSGVEIAWATTGDDAKAYIKTLHGQDMTEWEYHRVLGFIPKED